MGSDSEKDYVEIDLREVYYILVKNRRNIFKVTLCFIALAVLYLIVAPPVYESQAALRIKQQQGLGGSLLGGIGGGASFQRMSTYAEILKSRSVVMPVIEAIEEKEDDEYPEYEKYVDKHITTEALRDTEILNVKFKTDDPEKAHQGNSLLIGNLLSHMTRLSRDEQTAARVFLEERTLEAKAELGKADSAMEDYKARNKMINPSESAKLFADRIADIGKQTADNQVELMAAQARLASVNRQLQSSGASSADNQVIRQYNSELASLEARRIEYMDKYTEKHPRMIELNDRIAAMREMVSEEIAKVANLEAPSDNLVHQQLIESKYRSEGAIAVATEKAAALKAISDRNNEELEALPAIERGYVRVARDLQVANELYVMLAKRLEESKIAEVMTPNDVQIVDEPTLPEKPIAPRKLLTLVISTVLGIFAGSSYAVANVMMNRKITTEDDVMNYLGLATLGSVPEEESLKLAMDRRGKGESLWEKIGGWIWKN